MKRVLHLLRKKSQLTFPFINNQINRHVDFQPYVGVKDNWIRDGENVFSEDTVNATKYLDLGPPINTFEKLLSRSSRTLSKRQVGKLTGFIRENRIDILHFHFGTDCGTYHPLLKHIDIPSVVSFYGYDCSSFPSYAWGYGRLYLGNRVFSKVSKVFAMSPDMREDLLRAGCPADKIAVHYYGTDTRRFALKPAYQEKSKVTLLILATLRPKKGHLFLLKSLKRLTESGVNNFTLRIVGAGVQEELLRSYVAENGLEPYVVFAGAIKYASPEMMTEYREADIFVHPSVIAPSGDKEGIPGTVIEAMSAGIPVVSTYHAGIPYIVENEETGLLVKEQDVEALSQAIGRLIADVQLRRKIGLSGQAYASRYLDLDVKESELEDLYRASIDDQVKVYSSNARQSNTTAP